MTAAATYDAASTAVAAATTYALIEQYKVGMFDMSMVKAAVWGTYPQTMDMQGGNVVSILSIPQNNEGLGYALRNIPANHAAMMTHRNAIQAAALSSTFEQAGEFEMGAAIGPFERAQLLLLAYQGLNANNIVYDLVKKNGKTGTVGTVVQSLVERAIEDKVIKAGKKGKSGYIFYDTKDPMIWNAYASAGTLAATMVNCGAGRFAQAVSATLLYFNDLLEHETGLPGSDYGRAMGVAVGFSFFSHSIYGGGGPGVFNGNHVVTRHAAGVGMPCIVAACVLMQVPRCSAQRPHPRSTRTPSARLKSSRSRCSQLRKLYNFIKDSNDRCQLSSGQDRHRAFTQPGNSGTSPQPDCCRGRNPEDHPEWSPAAIHGPLRACP